MKPLIIYLVFNVQIGYLVLHLISTWQKSILSQILRILIEIQGFGQERSSKYVSGREKYFNSSKMSSFYCNTLCTQITKTRLKQLNNRVVEINMFKELKHFVRPIKYLLEYPARTCSCVYYCIRMYRNTIIKYNWRFSQRRLNRYSIGWKKYFNTLQILENH